MSFLSTFFPRHARPRTVVHAGPLLLTRSGGAPALRRYLRIPRRREVFLVHHGEDPLRAAAEEAGVREISVDAPARQEANAAAEMALALGARRLDFAIDEPRVSGPEGEVRGAISLHEAESLSRAPGIRPRIRAKLEAGCAALRYGMARVRIGDPVALTRGQATMLVPDPAVPSSTASRAGSAEGLGTREVSLSTVSPRDPWFRLRRAPSPRTISDGTAAPAA